MLSPWLHSITSGGSPRLLPACLLLLLAPASADMSESFSSNLWATGSDWTTGGWTRDDGSTPSSGTGPPSGADTDFYIFTEASDGSQGDVFSAVYNGNDCPASGNYVEFFYHMWGGGMGTLRLKDSNGAEQWSKSGDQGNSWQSAAVQLSTAAFTFEGVRGSSYESDMALDDVECHAPPSPSLPPAGTLGGGPLSFTMGFEDTEPGLTGPMQYCSNCASGRCWARDVCVPLCQGCACTNPVRWMGGGDCSRSAVYSFDWDPTGPSSSTNTGPSSA